MRFLTITIFAVTSRLVALVIATPIPNWKAGGMAIPLAIHSQDSNNITDLDVISAHGISVREKILNGLDNYEMNTGTMHPFAVRRSESGLRRRGALPLTSYPRLMWSAEISIGTPPQALKVQIDTGAADMWVLQTGCRGISGDRDLWNPGSSKSAKKGKSFRLSYSDGCKIKGNRYTDNVTVVGFTADLQTFGSATSYTSKSDIYGNFPADGLLGLAFPSVSDLGVLPLFESLVGQNKLMNPTFSLKLSSTGGEIYVGGVNSMLYNGDITYARVTEPGFWQVTMDDVRVNDHMIFKNVPAIFDTGSSYIFGDWDRVSKLYRILGGTLREHGGFGFYYLPCDAFPTVSFTFSGRTFKMPPEVLRMRPIAEGSSDCFSTIIAELEPIEFWTIGATFLQGVYSVFDYSTLQVGFADLA